MCRRIIRDRQDLPASALDHLGQDKTAGIHCADDVSFKDLLPVARPVVNERSYRSKYCGVRHKHMHVAVHPGHALDCRGKLLEIPYVRPKAVRGAAGVFDFQFGYVEFALAAADEAYADTGMSKPDCEPFPDSPPGASDQRGHVLVRVQKFILPPDLRLCRKDQRRARRPSGPIALGLVRAGPKKVVPFAGWLRPRKEITLHHWTAGGDESFALSFRFDPFERSRTTREPGRPRT